MMKKVLITVLTVIVLTGCTTRKELSYLNNIPAKEGESTFNTGVSVYKLQPSDIVYISIRTQTPEGGLEDLLTGQNPNIANQVQGEVSQYVTGYSIDPEGKLNLPIFGRIPASGRTIYELRDMLQEKTDSLFRHAYVEVRFLSYRFSVMGEVRVPGSYLNYSDQLNILEAISKAGGVTDYGNRKNVLVIRPVDNKTITYTVNLQDKNILESPAYFISPNDVIIVQETGRKVFSLNLPVYSLIISSIGTTLLLINYFK